MKNIIRATVYFAILISELSLVASAEVIAATPSSGQSVIAAISGVKAASSVAATPVAASSVAASSVVIHPVVTTPAVAAPAQPLASIAAVPVHACAPWQPSRRIEPSYLEKLERNAAKDKPKAGILYSQDKLLLLLAKDQVAAKAALAHKDKIEQKDGRVDLRGVDLNGFNLAGLNLDDVDLKGAEMNGTNLSGASLRRANLYKAEFEKANLDMADLSFANVGKANLEQASLCETILESSDMEDAAITGAYMKGARLDRAMHLPYILYTFADGILHFGLAVPPIK